MTEDWDNEPMLAGKGTTARGEPVVERGPDWDSATPVQVERVSVMEQNPESYVIGCCLIDDGATYGAAVTAGLRPQDFRDHKHRIIFTVLGELSAARAPLALDTLLPQLNGRLDQAGGVNYLLEVSDPLKIGTTARAGHFISRILQDSANRAAVSRAKDLLTRADRGEDVGEIVTRVTTPQRLPSTFSIPADDDKSVLLGNRFLNRGDGGILVGSSGMGKSSASIQMAYAWALGLPFHGIKPNGQLKILIIQSEDSDGDVAEVILSIVHMMKLSPAQLNEIDQRIRIVSDRVNRGANFISSLKGHITSFTPDLVIINPLQAFIDGDVTESRDLGRFLREGLNGLNDNKFGYLLIHHTTKPATGRDKGERQWHEVMYDMAGGAELINWARLVMSLRATETEGNFNLVLAKRGRRAGVTRTITQGTGTREEIVTTIPLRHAEGSIQVEGRKKPVSIIYWEDREPDVKAEHPESKSGRPEKYSFNDYRNVFPERTSAGLPLAELERRLLPNGAIKKNILANVLKRWADQGDVEIIQVHGSPTRYRATL